MHDLCSFVIGYVQEIEVLEKYYREPVLETKIKWCTLERPCVKVNFDGGYYQDLQSSSTGAIIKNEEGLIMGGYCSLNKNIPLVEVAEALATVQPIQFSKEMGFRRIELEGDSLVIISKLESQTVDRSEVRPYIREAHRVLSTFESFKLHHIKRGGNRVAHLIDKEGFLCRRDVQWVEEEPSVVMNLVAEEALGVP